MCDAIAVESTPWTCSASAGAVKHGSTTVAASQKRGPAHSAHALRHATFLSLTTRLTVLDAVAATRLDTFGFGHSVQVSNPVDKLDRLAQQTDRGGARP
jgi:hypothetical protein